MDDEEPLLSRADITLLDPLARARAAGGADIILFPDAAEREARRLGSMSRHDQWQAALREILAPFEKQ